MQTEVTASILGSAITDAELTHRIQFIRGGYIYSARAKLYKARYANKYIMTANFEIYTDDAICYRIKGGKLGEEYKPVKPSDNIGSISTELLEWLEEVTIAKLKELEAGEDNGEAD